MKRLTATVLGFLMVACLAACGGGSSGGSAVPPIVTPPTTPTPAPVPTITGPSGSLVANFTTNFPAAAHSVVFTFTPAGGTAVSSVVAIPSSCGSTPTCSLTSSAPVGSNESIQALLYATANGTGTALAVGSGTASVFANQPTNLNFPLTGIMATFTVKLSPSTVTVGQTASITITENAFDAAGEALAAGFVNTALSAPIFIASVTDPSGVGGFQPSEGPGIMASTYSGVGSGPITYTVQTANYPTAAASLNFTAATPFTAGFALFYNPQGSGACDVRVYAAASSTPMRNYTVLPCGAAPVFDPNGTIWVNKFGINPDGTLAGAFPVPGTLLAFDLSDKSYVADPTTNALDVYSGSTLLRQINLSAAPIAAAVDPSGNIYVGLASGGVNEYGPIGNGNISPITVNPTASAPETDGAGNVYAVPGLSSVPQLGVWQAGTFGPSAPGRTLTPPSVPGDASAKILFGVDRAGDVYAISNSVFVAPTFAFASAGSGAFAQLPPDAGLLPSRALPLVIAVPIK